MTTIVYNHKDKQIAIDSRSSRDNVIITDNAIKWRTEQGALFFLCGLVPDFDMLIEAYFGKALLTVPEANAFVIDKGIPYRIGVTEELIFWKSELTNSDSFGSGASFALAALDFKLSAAEAIEYTKTRDCYTGGTVHTYDLVKARFVYDAPE